LNRYLIALILILISIAIAAVLIYFGIISLDVGIIISILAAIIFPLVLALLPIAIEHGLKPKVDLRIENVRFTKKSRQDVTGYQLEASVTNHGDKICLNLEPTFKITDDNDKSANLLYVSIEERNDHETVTAKELPMRDIGFAWVIDNKTVRQATLDKLRKDDVVGLIFPYETFGIATLGKNSSTSHDSEHWLKVEPQIEYKVTVTIKGEDAESCTVIKSKQIVLRV
jgi:hypothetical protein